MHPAAPHHQDPDALARSPFPHSDHFDGRRFFNPGAVVDRSLADLWRWRRTSQPSPWPARRLNRAYPPPPSRQALAPGTVALTFVGQSTFLITTAFGTVITDPVFSDRVSPVSFLGPRRVRPPGLALEAVPPLDAILVSHNHYDHMDIASLRALSRDGTVPIVTGLGNDRPLRARGIGNVTTLDWWDATAPIAGLQVTYVPAQHWSSRKGFDRRRALWGGFVLQAGARRIYFAGDSGYCACFAAIRTRCGAPDLALLPIGAYEPRWFMESQHMNPADAVRAHGDLRATQSVGMHFGTVQLTDEAIDEPLHALARARQAAGLDASAFITLDVGETRLFGFGGT